MNSALIVMTILGCNDAATDCHYIATTDNRWPSIELCNSVSEQQLAGYTNQPYPMIVAVCQKPESTEVADIPAKPALPELLPTTTPDPQPVTAQEKQTFADRAIERVRSVLPTTEGVKTVMTSPVRLVEGSYSWIARRLGH